MAKKIGVLLSGCGVSDGSEIYETTLTLLHIAKAGARAVVMAPDVAQAHVWNHQTNQTEANQTRNVRDEAARLNRGPVHNVADVTANMLDALIVPGGFGAAKNLSDFAFVENVNDIAAELHCAQLVQDMFAAGKPQGFICIAPASVAAVALKGKGVNLTIGNDAATAKKIMLLGNRHTECAVEDIIVDEAHKIVSTPAYMLAETIVQAEAGIARLVKQVMAFTVY